jgi:probable DNA metabolism protein
MTVLVHDGSFEGLMTVLYRIFMEGEEGEEIVAAGDFQPGLFTPSQRVETRENQATAMMDAIRGRVSPKALRHSYYAFATGKRGTGTMIHRYLKKGFSLGAAVDARLLDPDVAALHNLSRKVGRELHRLLGLTRFRLLAGGLLYAPLQPDYEILALLAPHFALRLPRENWIIHDVKRSRAALYNRREWVLTDLRRTGKLPLDQEERELQELWRNYFSHIAIAERKNPKLQAGHMPKKYWQYLVEKEIGFTPRQD